jgi:hypothetical protein
MNGAQPHKAINNLTQLTRAAGLALREGDMGQLRECVSAIAKAGGTIESASKATLGNKPSQLPHLTRKAGNAEDTRHRAINHERPSQGHSR